MTDLINIESPEIDQKKYPVDPRKSLIQRHKRIMKALEEIDGNLAYMYQIYQDFHNEEHLNTLTYLGKLFNLFQTLMQEFRREM